MGTVRDDEQRAGTPRALPDHVGLTDRSLHDNSRCTAQLVPVWAQMRPNFKLSWPRGPGAIAYAVPSAPKLAVRALPDYGVDECAYPFNAVACVGSRRGRRAKLPEAPPLVRGLNRSRVVALDPRAAAGTGVKE